MKQQLGMKFISLNNKISSDHTNRKDQCSPKIYHLFANKATPLLLKLKKHNNHTEKMCTFLLSTNSGNGLPILVIQSLTKEDNNIPPNTSTK